jgi:hypothetical protein
MNRLSFYDVNIICLDNYQLCGWVLLILVTVNLSELTLFLKVVSLEDLNWQLRILREVAVSEPKSRSRFRY